MGVTGLFRVIKQHLTPTNIANFKGKVAAVDMSCWIHVYLHRKRMDGYPVAALVSLLLDRINVLLQAEVTPLIILDGDTPPAKAESVAQRERFSAENLRKAAECDANNDTAGAANFRSRARTRTKELTDELIKKLKELNIPFVMAPYEADSQLAWMVQEGYADLVLTVDTDLILYGCKRILFQMNRDGDGFMYEQEQVLTKVLGSSFDLQRWRWCCILAGCDYFLGGIKGVGMYKATQLYTETEEIPDEKSFVKYILTKKDLRTSTTFGSDFLTAEMTFCHQVVYDVRAKCNVHLTPLPEGTTSSEVSCAGSLLTSNQVIFQLTALDRNAEPIPVIKSVFKCLRCDERFDTRAEKITHWNEFHVRLPSQKSFALNQAAAAIRNAKLVKRRNKVKPHQCTTCKTAFVRPWDLKNHILLVHKKLRPFKCPICNKGCGNKTLLKEHMGVHNMNVKKFICDHCNHDFKYASGLWAHRLSLKNERRYQCSKCDKSFKLAGNLQSHEKTHLEPKDRQRFQCDLCPCSYLQKEELTRHKKQKHIQPKRWPCELCGKDYAAKKGLVRHQKDIHGVVKTKTRSTKQAN